MIMNNNVKRTLEYGAIITWGLFRFKRYVEFHTGKEIYIMWYHNKRVGTYEDFYDMVEDHYKMTMECERIIFDYKKLDKYKISLDDGFLCCNEMNLYSDKLEDIVLCDLHLYKVKDMYIFSIIDYECNLVIKIKEKIWSRFVYKVQNYFLDKENN